MEQTDRSKKLLIACNIAKGRAIKDGRRQFVAQDENRNYIVRPYWMNNWLFNAYPGGRSELSRTGLDILAEKPTAQQAAQHAPGINITY